MSEDERVGQVIGWKFLCPCLSFPSPEWQPCASPLCDTGGYALKGQCGSRIRRSLSRLVAQAKPCRLEFRGERLRLPWVLKTQTAWAVPQHCPVYPDRGQGCEAHTQTVMGPYLALILEGLFLGGGGSCTPTWG